MITATDRNYGDGVPCYWDERMVLETRVDNAIFRTLLCYYADGEWERVQFTDTEWSALGGQ